MSKNAGHLVLFNAIKLLSHSAFALIRFKLINLFQTITTCFEIICIDGLEIYRSFSLSRTKKINWKPSSGRNQENEML